jgi:hypothetical protein
MNPPTSNEGTILQSFTSLSPTEQQQHKIPLLNDRYEFNVEALGLLRGHSPLLTRSPSSHLCTLPT